MKEDAAFSPTPLTNLGNLYDGAMVHAVAYDNREHLPVDVALHVKTIESEVTTVSRVTSDTVTASNDRPSGIATWTISPQPSGIEPYECLHELSYNTDGTEVLHTDAAGAEATNPKCPLPPIDTTTGETQNDLATDGTVDEHSQKVLIGESRWHTVNVQGVDMIVIDVPIGVRHRMDEDEMAELLLIQDGEFVRRGARIGERSVDDETAYNAAAFDTLLPVIVDYIKPSTAESGF